MGNPKRGERTQRPLRAPNDYWATWDEEARAEGYDSTNSYVVARLAEATGRPIPAWATPRRSPNQVELAVGA